MRYLYQIIAFVLFILITGGCNTSEAPDCLKSTGELQVQYRPLSSFNAIELEDNVNLWLTYGSANTIRVEAGKNLIDKIKTEISEGTLRITNANTCNWVRSYKVPVNVYLECDQINFIKHTGFGSIMFENVWQADYLEYKHYGAGSLKMLIQASRLNLDHNGLGEAELEGVVDHAYFAVQNLGPLKAKSLKVSTCVINNVGQADAIIQCIQQLEAKTTSVGSIYYYGNPPQVYLLATGRGKIIPR